MESDRPAIVHCSGGVGFYGFWVDDCGEGVWHCGCCEGWEGAGLKEGLDVWVGDVGLGVGDSFEVEGHAGSEGVWRP